MCVCADHTAGVISCCSQPLVISMVGGAYGMTLLAVLALKDSVWTLPNNVCPLVDIGEYIKGSQCYMLGHMWQLRLPHYITNCSPANKTIVIGWLVLYH